MTAAQAHRQQLAQFEGRRYCSVVEAARYLDISERVMRELLYSQKVASQYVAKGKLRKVVVASLLEYADGLPIDRPVTS